MLATKYTSHLFRESRNKLKRVAEKCYNQVNEKWHTENIKLLNKNRKIAINDMRKQSKWSLQTSSISRAKSFPRLPTAPCLLLLVSLLPAFSCFACCGYKRGVDYKIMKIYCSPSKTSRWMERKGYAICRAFRELCPWSVMKMAKQQWQLPGTLSTLSAAFSYPFSYPLSFFLYALLRTASLQVYSFYRRNWIDTPISLILSSLFQVSETRLCVYAKWNDFRATSIYKICKKTIVNINWILLYLLFSLSFF